MKCEICGNEMAIWADGQKTHGYLETCVSVLLRRLEDANKENASLKNKLAERPASETIPERFANLRKALSVETKAIWNKGNCDYVNVMPELKDLLAAHEEVVNLIKIAVTGVRIFPDIDPHVVGNMTPYEKSIQDLMCKFSKWLQDYS
jgi:Icc-related predicted phosphoesterase